jgi:hypothetical protein
MNKNEIGAVVGMFDLSADIAKSLVNRLESALTKDGTPSAKLRMASSSLLALSDKCEEDSTDEAVTLALGSFLAIFAEIAKESAPKAPTTKAPKAEKKTRENWYPADSTEGQAIIAKTTPKPSRTKKNAPAPEVADEILALLVQAINARG